MSTLSWRGWLIENEYRGRGGGDEKSMQERNDLWTGDAESYTVHMLSPESRVLPTYSASRDQRKQEGEGGGWNAKYTLIVGWGVMLDAMERLS